MITPRVGAPLLALALTACAATLPEPIDTAAVLARLRAAPVPEQGTDGAVVLAPMDAAAMALRHNPALRARRAAVGVAVSELEEAGVLPDPSIGWDAMGAIAAEWIDGDASRVDVASGYGVSWRVPRPGEMAAREERGLAGLDLARADLMGAEWDLVAGVLDACVSLEDAHRRLELHDALLPLLEGTGDYLAAAAGAGEVTRVDVSLAAGELAMLRDERLVAEAGERDARRHLCALLGLSPDTPLDLRDAEVLLEFPRPAPDPEVLVDRALDRRPDLARLVAVHRGAAADLAMALSGRWPGLTIGTGFEIVLPLFSRFQGAAVETARRREEVARLEVEAAVFRMRAEAWDATAALDVAARRMDLATGDLLPRANEGLERALLSLRSGEITVLQALAVHRQALEAREQVREARSRAARAWIRCRAVGGDLVNEPSRADRPGTPDEGEDSR